MTVTRPAPRSRRAPRAVRKAEHTIEIVSDSGEGAQKCGQIFGAVSAKMGNGVWTVEIIPAEIQPPPRVPEGASGYRIRFGVGAITNWGDATDLVLAFNEQVLLARHRLGALAEDAVLLVEDKWATDDDAEIRAAWAAGMEELSHRRYRIIPVPMEAQCLTLVDNPRKGKNMFALGLLACIYGRDLERI
ncbi:MAG TPA: 2-oxoacid:acceptor oxidoreductase family protein [Gemmatimonadales bacterium]|nr:2-oxoacid:acceptor oxidoreductase family protein [Gemmatimonadales bacterium]